MLTYEQIPSWWQEWGHWSHASHESHHEQKASFFIAAICPSGMGQGPDHSPHLLPRRSAGPHELARAWDLLRQRTQLSQSTSQVHSFVDQQVTGKPQPRVRAVIAQHFKNTIVQAMKTLFYLMLWMSFMAFGFVAAVATKTQVLHLL